MKVPNFVIDEVMAEISHNSFRCYLAIMRKTTGSKKESSHITTDELMNLTSIKNKRTVYSSIKELESHSLITKVKTNTQYGNIYIITGNWKSKGISK